MGYLQKNIFDNIKNENVVNFCKTQVLVSNTVNVMKEELTQYPYLYQISGLEKLDGDI